MVAAAAAAPAPAAAWVSPSAAGSPTARPPRRPSSQCQAYLSMRTVPQTLELIEARGFAGAGLRELDNPGRDPLVDAQAVAEGIEQGEAGSAVVVARALPDAGVEVRVVLRL